MHTPQVLSTHAYDAKKSPIHIICLMTVKYDLEKKLVVLVKNIPLTIIQIKSVYYKMKIKFQEPKGNFGANVFWTHHVHMLTK